MKTTLDLPDHLVYQAKQRALQQGRTLRELVAEYIRQGLHGSTAASAPAAIDGVRIDLAGLPVFRCEPSSGKAGIGLAAALQLEQECLMQEDRRRAGLPA
ncbi:hypothetical protein [Synechococcus sp. 1G10]|uniref:hypothetical protein n=1 Tax=Synechococcus sp. 1G10 TaxID=2025605 RepID=UPI000B98F4F0|nr:hypothetical protein [Synechococcus sp. 1G10]